MKTQLIWINLNLCHLKLHRHPGIFVIRGCHNMQGLRSATSVRFCPLSILHLNSWTVFILSLNKQNLGSFSFNPFLPSLKRLLGVLLDQDDLSDRLFSFHNFARLQEWSEIALHASVFTLACRIHKQVNVRSGGPLFPLLLALLASQNLLNVLCDVLRAWLCKDVLNLSGFIR